MLALFNSVGIWPEGADGTDVNACSKSHTRSLLAAADDFGKVALFSYPSFVPKVCCKMCTIIINNF